MTDREGDTPPPEDPPPAPEPAPLSAFADMQNVNKSLPRRFGTAPGRAELPPLSEHPPAEELPDTGE